MPFSKAQMLMFAKRGTRPLLISKFGLAEDPIGADITWGDGKRTYLARVEGVRRDDEHGYILLKTRYFNGEEGPEVSAGIVQVLLRPKTGKAKCCEEKML